MNGCRMLFEKQGFETIKKLEWGYSVRVGCYNTTLDDVEFVSAVEVIKSAIPTDEELALMESEAVKIEKNALLDKLTQVANSSEIKRFIKGEKNLWWNSETRASIRASLEARAEGWYLDFDGCIVEYDSMAEALEIVDLIEVYASDCHQYVCAMRAEIEEIASIRALVDYEFRWPRVVTISENTQCL